MTLGPEWDSLDVHASLYRAREESSSDSFIELKVTEVSHGSDYKPEHSFSADDFSYELIGRATSCLESKRYKDIRGEDVRLINHHFPADEVRESESETSLIYPTFLEPMVMQVFVQYFGQNTFNRNTVSLALAHEVNKKQGEY